MTQAASRGAGNKVRPMATSRRIDISLDDFMISEMIEYQTCVHYTILVAPEFLVKFRLSREAGRTPHKKTISTCMVNRYSILAAPTSHDLSYGKVYLGRQL